MKCTSPYIVKLNVFSHDEAYTKMKIVVNVQSYKQQRPRQSSQNVDSEYEQYYKLS